MKCPITLNNGVVTCFMYDDIEVQIPAIEDKNATEIEVEYKDGKYIIIKDKKKTVREAVKPEAKTDSKPKFAKEYFKH